MTRLATIRAAIFAALLACLGAEALAAPTHRMYFSHLSLQDGLSQNNVQAIFQDSAGYMWFATENGLNRYDGYEIDVYSRERGNLDGFANDFVWVIVEDSNRDLWLATQGGGVVRWNRKDASFNSFRHDPADPNSLSSNDIRTLRVNDDGTIWVGTRDSGVNLLNPTDGSVERFQHRADDPTSLSNDMIYGLIVDRHGVLWVGTDAGVNRYDAETGVFHRYQNDESLPRSLSQDQVRSIFEDQSGTLWIGTRTGGLNRFDGDAEGFSRFLHDPTDASTVSNNHIRVMFEDDAQRMWVGTTDGLNLFDREQGSFQSFKNERGNAQSLRDSYINSIYQDRSGLLWVGTRSAGLSIWNPRSWSLGHYLKPWLEGADVTSFASDGKGGLWVGTVGEGLARIDESTHELERYRHRAGDAATISDDQVMSLLLDNQGTLWIGTRSAGLNRLDPVTGDIRTFRHRPDDPRSLGSDGVMAIYEDRDGKLWVGTYGGGVSVLDRDTETFTRYAHNANDPASLSDPRATAFAETTNGVMWVGTFGGGLNRFNASNGTFERFKNDPHDASSLAENTVYSLHADAAGRVWVGTAGGGLDRIIAPEGAPENVSFANYSHKDGLPSNVVYGVQSDAANNVWLSTNYGISRLDPETSQIKTFHEGHGLQGEEFNFGAHHRGADGKLYFGGPKGFNAFHPDRVQTTVYAPPIVLTGFQNLHKPELNYGPIDQLAGVELAHGDDVVSFEYAALDFTQSTKNRYSYQLEGFDDAWVDLGTARRVTLTNLDAGSYVLNVRAVTSDGVSARSQASLPIVVAPAPWNTLWAYALYAAFAAMLVYLAWRAHRARFEREAVYSRRLEEDVELRTRQLAERNEELQVASRAKSDFLARMSHEIRTPMNGMMGMTQLLMGTSLNEKQHRFTHTIKRSCESLLEIINDILDFSKIEAGKLELAQVDFDVTALVEETVELFAGAASDKGVELLCSTPPGRAVAAVGDPQRMRQILVNLLGNAIKFTQDGEIMVRCTVEESDAGELALRFDITDTGVGIRPENFSLIFDSFSQEDGSTSRQFGGTGLGLAICKQLTEMMGGRIGVDSEYGAGSHFWFTVKLPKAEAAWPARNVSFRLANRKVLVADSNLNNAEIVAGYLSALGVQATPAVSGYDALRRLDAAAGSAPFDLVIVDRDLGDMSGLKFANVIKNGPKAHPAKVVLMTPAGSTHDEQEMQRSGIDDCLAKPIQQSALYESLLMLTASSTAPVSRTERDTEQNLEPLKGNVLLVEDNPVNQAVALGMLEELGCEAVVAINGEDAIRYIAQGTFDLVLMDCEMPVMDGFEATAATRRLNSAARNVPIVALTANAVDGDRERCLESGMQDYLSKPITLEALHSALDKWLPTENKKMQTNDSGAIDRACLESIRNLKGVGGERMVKRVVELYCSNSAMLLEELRMAVAKADPERIRQAAHALKSSSQNVGALGMASVSQQIEAMGRSGDLHDLQSHMVDLNDLYTPTVLALKGAVHQVHAC